MKKFLICLFIFIVTGLGSAFLGVPGSATFAVSGICALLYLILSRKKGKSTTSRGATVNSSSSSSNSSSGSHQPAKHTDYFDERNIPSHWVRARACDKGVHGDVTVSQGNATHCFKCGAPFEGEWGDRGMFDGYFCQIHNKWIPRGSYCAKCKNEGLIN